MPGETTTAATTSSTTATHAGTSRSTATAANASSGCVVGLPVLDQAPSDDAREVVGVVDGRAASGDTLKRALGTMELLRKM